MSGVKWPRGTWESTLGALRRQGPGLVRAPPPALVSVGWQEFFRDFPYAAFVQLDYAHLEAYARLIGMD